MLSVFSGNLRNSSISKMLCSHPKFRSYTVDIISLLRVCECPNCSGRFRGGAPLIFDHCVFINLILHKAQIARKSICVFGFAYIFCPPPPHYTWIFAKLPNGRYDITWFRQIRAILFVCFMFCSNHDRKRTFWGCVHAYFAKAESFCFWYSIYICTWYNHNHSYFPYRMLSEFSGNLRDSSNKMPNMLCSHPKWIRSRTLMDIISLFWKRVWMSVAILMPSQPGELTDFAWNWYAHWS